MRNKGKWQRSEFVGKELNKFIIQSRPCKVWASISHPSSNWSVYTCLDIWAVRAGDICLGVISVSMTFRPWDHLSSAKERKHQGPSSKAFLHLEVRKWRNGQWYRCKPQRVCGVLEDKKCFQKENVIWVECY